VRQSDADVKSDETDVVTSIESNTERKLDRLIASRHADVSTVNQSLTIEMRRQHRLTLGRGR